MHEFLAQLANGVELGAIYALIALGYTLVYGILELINFAHGDVYTFGSFTALVVLVALRAANLLHGAGLILGIVAALVVAILACALLNAGIERLAYRRLRKAPRLAPLITAIGVSFMLENLIELWQGAAPVPFPNVIPNPELEIGALQVGVQQIVVVALAIATMIALHFFVKRSRLGKAMRAVAQDRDASSLVGIDVDRTIAITFLIAGALAGVAGFVGGVSFGSAWFLNGFGAGLRAFTAAVLGGIGNIAGAMLGGFLIGLLESFSTWFIGGQWSNVAVFSVLILVLVFRPSGLLGESLPEKV